MTSTRTVTATALAALLTLPVAFAGAPAAQAADEAPKILLVLDASGSMKEPDPSGLTKIDAAKKALTRVVDTIPAGTQVGLRVYGATQPGGKPTKAACADTQLVHPINALDKPGLKTAIASFNARGETPIAHSLSEGAKDLGASGKRHIILVSDGEESCVPDPCPEIKKLAGLGIDLTIDTVGFNVTDKAKKQLACIADASQGTYYDAKNATDLDKKLTRLATRAARPFTTTGTPVIGTELQQTAPTLTAGQYLDTIPSSPSATTVRYYRVKRTMPGSTITVGVSSRMPSGQGAANVQYGNWNLHLFEPVAEGSQPTCDQSTMSAGDFLGIGNVVSDAVSATPLGDPASTDRAARACAEASEVMIAVRRMASDAPDARAEILVTEEPPVANSAALPAPATDAPKPESFTFATGTPKPVVLGTGFADAPLLEPGLYSTELVPGEQVFARFHLDYGQRAAFQNLGPGKSDSGWGDRGDTDMYQFLSYAYSPQRRPLNLYDQRAIQPGVAMSPLTLVYPEVRYRNRFAQNAPHTTAAGDYFAALNLNHQWKDNGGAPVTVRFAIARQGTPSGQPQFAPAGSASAGPEAPAPPGADASASASTAADPAPSVASASPAPSETDAASAGPAPAAASVDVPPAPTGTTADPATPAPTGAGTGAAASGPSSAVPSAPVAVGVGLVMAAVVGGAVYLKSRRHRGE